MPEISVIVPVYKVEPYLRRCVDSILNQTFTDFKLILVDDGSPDNCPAICDEYAGKDDRVHVIHQENGGLSAARNAGIDWAFANSDSHWINFVDSDDWVHPEYLDRLYKAAINEECIVSVCDFAETSGETPIVHPENITTTLWDSEEFYCARCVTATIACGKLYRKNCFDGLRYPTGKIHEDEFVTYKILFSTRKIVEISPALYFYFQNVESITQKAWTPSRLDALKAFDIQISYFKANHYQKAYVRRIRSYLWMLCSQYYGAASNKQKYLDEISIIKKRIRKAIRKYSQQIDKSWSEYTLAYAIAFPIFAKIRDIMNRTTN